jgi:AhpD family alkylhydroperoxidase
MSARANYAQLSPQLVQKFLAFTEALGASSLDPTIHELVKIRASQLNGCAFCVDMHVKQARLGGERELRLHHVAVWRESPLFSPRERAALEWTEALTALSETRDVPEDLYERARQQFGERELSDLTFAVMAINGWNRASVAFRAVPGSLDDALGLSKAGLS